MALPDGPPRALNGPAELIWEVAVSGSSDVIATVAAFFDVEPAAIASDVKATLKSLEGGRLIERRQAAGDK
ncbi:hypothetical protein GA707_09800 [Nostocoides sp. F2B08]|uniref:PqqD family peptide modification chaperone n=1 Tax=Nostocoides sp. F2B08 TaxID=2653936 RepID=UPI0012636DDB|nr:PqqD family peptide modification chaperone [Tetrasphaera sp. F2B08]KAB7744850.1 hypothetical protein GA707_09800 [Tetrasphaera sp. F2B08]